MALLTLLEPVRFQEDIKKSRFLALAAPVDSAEQALQFFQENSVADATHNCWAYKIGAQYRFNDDGEPGGTAGRPILQAIEGQDCDRVAVLVIRWFGGVKLGTGGLVRAYGGVAAQCLRLADKRELVPMMRMRCRCAFGELALIQSRFETFAVQVQDEQFDSQGVVWTLALPQDKSADFQQAFINMTRGQGECVPLQPVQ
ncbi:IMPACT family protein [Alcaligenes sp. SDU_A2]|uniref:IMPACT family protein n=1 Tax=Alcaligenes sp. SDU_A2 TaxID=3136634 RepID=UPI00311DDF80